MAGKKFALKKEVVRSNVGGVMPEIVDHQGRTWTVVEGESGEVDRKRLILTVPAGEENRRERVRLLTKLRISPETPDWAKAVADPSLIDLMEDLRASKAMAEQFDDYLPLVGEADAATRTELTNNMRKGDLLRAARAWLRAKSTDSYPDFGVYYGEVTDQWQALIRNDAPLEERERAERLVDQARDEYEDFSRHVAAVERLVSADDYRTSVAAAKLLEDLPTIRKPGGRQTGGNSNQGADTEASSFEDLVNKTNPDLPEALARHRGMEGGENLDEKAKQAFNEALAKAKVGGAEGDGPPGFEGVGAPADEDASQVSGGPVQEIEWGTVTWVKPPLVRNLLLHKTARQARSTDEGAVIRNMHRWYTDKRIFTRKRRVPGGTLLVDCSGSMSLTPQQIDGLIEVSPHATVVLYSGRSGRGNMVVAAKKGKRVGDGDVTTHNFGGNEIDGPALEWLAKQEEPRVWVSDGMACVSGPYDVEMCVRWCARFAKKNSIVRMPNFDEAVRLLRRLW